MFLFIFWSLIPNCIMTLQNYFESELYWDSSALHVYSYTNFIEIFLSVVFAFFLILWWMIVPMSSLLLTSFLFLASDKSIIIHENIKIEINKEAGDKERRMKELKGVWLNLQPIGASRTQDKQIGISEEWRAFSEATSLTPPSALHCHRLPIDGYLHDRL